MSDVRVRIKFESNGKDLRAEWLGMTKSAKEFGDAQIHAAKTGAAAHIAAHRQVQSSYDMYKAGMLASIKTVEEYRMEWAGKSTRSLVDFIHQNTVARKNESLEYQKGLAEGDKVAQRIHGNEMKRLSLLNERLKEVSIEREEVQKRGVGALIGQLGVGRNLNEAFGVSAEGVGRLAAAGALTYGLVRTTKEFVGAGMQAAQTLQSMRLAFEGAGLSGRTLDAEIERTNKLADDLSIRWNIASDRVRSLTGYVAQMGNVTGQRSGDIVKMGLAVEELTQQFAGGAVNAEQFAKVLVGDPEAEVYLGRLRLAFPVLAEQLKGAANRGDEARIAMEFLAPKMKELDARAQSNEQALKRAGVAWDEMKRAIGLTLVGGLSPVLSSLGALAGVLTKNAQVVGPFVLAIGGLTTAFAALVIVRKIAHDQAVVDTIESIRGTIAHWGHATATAALATATGTLATAEGAETIVAIDSGAAHIAAAKAAQLHAAAFTHLAESVGAAIAPYALFLAPIVAIGAAYAVLKKAQQDSIDKNKELLAQIDKMPPQMQQAAHDAMAWGGSLGAARAQAIVAANAAEELAKKTTEAADAQHWYHVRQIESIGTNDAFLQQFDDRRTQYGKEINYLKQLAFWQIQYGQIASSSQKELAEKYKGSADEVIRGLGKQLEQFTDVSNKLDKKFGQFGHPETDKTGKSVSAYEHEEKVKNYREDIKLFVENLKERVTIGSLYEDDEVKQLRDRLRVTHEEELANAQQRREELKANYGHELEAAGDNKGKKTALAKKLKEDLQKIDDGVRDDELGAQYELQKALDEIYKKREENDKKLSENRKRLGEEERRNAERLAAVREKIEDKQAEATIGKIHREETVEENRHKHELRRIQELILASKDLTSTKEAMGLWDLENLTHTQERAKIQQDTNDEEAKSLEEQRKKASEFLSGGLHPITSELETQIKDYAHLGKVGNQIFAGLLSKAITLGENELIKALIESFDKPKDSKLPGGVPWDAPPGFTKQIPSFHDSPGSLADSGALKVGNKYLAFGDADDSLINLKNKPHKPSGPFSIGGKNPTGLRELGNINLNTRRVVHNPDGSISTEQSISIGTDRGETLIPTVINGKHVSVEEAKRHYFQTGENLGTFESPEAADAYAIALHNRQDSHYHTRPVVGGKGGGEKPHGQISPMFLGNKPITFDKSKTDSSSGSTDSSHRHMATVSDTERASFLYRQQIKAEEKARANYEHHKRLRKLGLEHEQGLQQDALTDLPFDLASGGIFGGGKALIEEGLGKGVSHITKSALEHSLGKFFSAHGVKDWAKEEAAKRAVEYAAEKAQGESIRTYNDSDGPIGTDGPRTPDGHTIVAGHPDDWLVKPLISKKEAATRDRTDRDGDPKKTIGLLTAIAQSGKMTADHTGVMKDGITGNKGVHKAASGIGGLLKSVSPLLSLIPGGGAAADLGGALLGMFDEGTDRIPRDGLAYVHKNERITPAKFNPTLNERSSANSQLSSAHFAPPQAQQRNDGGMTAAHPAILGAFKSLENTVSQLKLSISTNEVYRGNLQGSRAANTISL